MGQHTQQCGHCGRNVVGAAKGVGADGHYEIGTELGAVTEWVHGIAALTRSKMTDAVTRLDRASERSKALMQPAHAAHAQVPKIMALAVLGQHEAAASGLATKQALLNLGEFHAAAKGQQQPWKPFLPVQSVQMRFSTLVKQKPYLNNNRMTTIRSRAELVWLRFMHRLANLIKR